MTKTPFEMVREFHTSMGLSVYEQNPSRNLLKLRLNLIEEEFNEISDEFYDHLGFTTQFDKKNLTKELADLLYVTYGFAVSLGLPIDEVFNRVHKSNMTKLVDGKPLKNEQGKVLKGPNYQPPYLDDLFPEG